MNRDIASALCEFVAAADNLLGKAIVAAYCFGSAVYHDFHLGYSDLDFFIVVDATLSQENFQDFHGLRKEYRRSVNPYLGVLEGEIVPYSAIKNGDRQGNTIYWGTSRDRFNTEFGLRGFSMCGLLDVGYLIHGHDIRSEIPYPSRQEMLAQVGSLIRTLGEYAVQTDRDIHSVDWFFLIAQSIYWLKTGKTTGKTPAAKWVLINCHYPWQKLLEKAIELRLSPDLARRESWQLWLEGLGERVLQACASLEAEFKCFNKR